MSGVAAVKSATTIASASLVADAVRRDGMAFRPAGFPGEITAIRKYNAAKIGHVEPTLPESPHTAHTTAANSHSIRANCSFEDSCIVLNLKL
jgi:hypothetical protein